MSRPPLRHGEPPWPSSTDVATREAAGWVPYPLHSFVLKVHSRCDLACDYCYMYRSADQGWRAQPRTMAPATVDRTARRIAEHLSAHGLSEAGVVLHGGEPLLAGDAALARTVRTLRAAVGPGVRLRFSLQTNGVRLTERRLDLCGELGVRIGVSVDGGRAAHDRHRRGADGRGSHGRVREALRLLAKEPYRPLFAALLCTIDLRNDPVRTYEELLVHRPPTVDFLLPLGHWRTPPPGLVPGARRTPYADWLWAVFERWYGAPARETGVRLLDDLMALLLGAAPQTEALGLSPVRYAVVETDGSLAQDDTLRTAYDGAARTGLDVWRHSFDELLRHPGIAARQWGADALCATCRSCPLHQVCGGGHYANRYRPDTGFANPSVYCADLTALIGRVRGRLAADMAKLPGARPTARAAAAPPGAGAASPAIPSPALSTEPA
ncbi:MULTISPECIES: FxsB family cyclophane-forming radical SAM/SPASM peptide maturase [Streptomyces]|uniref:FxsB family cyclophane-forming radical SAM/SPASM peptide maturase n=1 Tax=Streptomyces TaxID=1883 RepID=UPI001316E68D|nr:MULTISPECIES: FxsB family cyclophane-forming radical SAM/SPASM peptide maturase [Streptomyces]QGZ51550.1 FxsB family radical SAM/SPASM domain protein [Streptomyces sp. QHH-9511]